MNDVSPEEKVMMLEKTITFMNTSGKRMREEINELNRENNKLEQQNKRYRERMAQLINYIEMTDDDVDQQVHKIHVILDRTLEGESNE